MFRPDLLFLYAAMLQIRIISCGQKCCIVYKY